MKTNRIVADLEEEQATTDCLLPEAGLLPVRLLLCCALLLVLAGVAWLATTEIDLVVQGRGHLTTEGEPVFVATLEGGRIVSVPVQVGQELREGEVLLQFDSFDLEAEVAEVALQLDQLQTKADAHGSRADRLVVQRDRVELEIAVSERQETLEGRAYDRDEELYRNKQLSEADLERRENQMLDRQRQILRLRREAHTLETEAEQERSLALQFTAERSVLLARLETIRTRLERLRVRAPVDGIVSWMAAVHPGAVLRPGEPVAHLLPAGRPVVARIEIPNASMGRVRCGARVRIEVDAFPRQDFGQIDGLLERVDPDVNPRGFYHAWVSLVTNTADDHGSGIHLHPGMWVTTRISSGRRSLLSYLLSPVRRPFL